MRATTGRDAAACTAAIALALTACGSGEPDGGAQDTGENTLTVLAAASLRDVFTELSAEFESRHPDVDVVLSFAGSAELADQVLAGIPADVFAAADERTMARVVDAGDASDPVTFATNTLALVTPPGNPADVTSFADLAREDVKVVVCAPEVPCGSATDAVEEASGVAIHRVSEERSVTDVLAKVTSGEADAGLVYATDAALAGDAVERVGAPETAVALNRYPVAALATGHDAEARDDSGPESAGRRTSLAQRWIDLLTSGAGRSALESAGFGTP